jgi:hypothetical protein
MADGLHEVYFGGGAQTLTHVPLARPSAATYAIEDLTESDDGPNRFIVAAATPATVDPYSVTLSAAAGPGEADPRLLTFTAGTAPTVGNAYALEHTDGRSELVRCIGGTTTTMRLAAPLMSAFPSLSTVRGIQIPATFPLAAAADADRFENDEPCRITWSYTMRGLVWRISELIRLQRTRAEARHVAAVALELQRGWSELCIQQASTSHAVEDVVRYAARRLDSRLRSKNIEPAEFFSGEQGFDLLLQRSIVHLADLGAYPKSRQADLFRSEQLAEFLKLWDGITVGTSGKGTTDLDRSTDTAHSGSPSKRRNPFVAA